MNKMIRKTCILLLVSVMLISGAAVCFAEVELTRYSWSDKLSRGAINIISSPVEIGRSIHVTSQVDGVGYGWTVGLLQGIGMTIVRMGAGVVDVITSPFDFPDENKAPLVKPEYPWQRWNSDYV